MSRSREIRGKVLASVGVLAGVIIAFILLTSSPPKNVGGLVVQANLPDGTGVTEINYTISGNGIEAISGSVPVADPRASAEILAKNIPADTEYALQLSASSRDGNNKCARHTTFDIAAGKTTPLTVLLLCQDMSRVARFLKMRQAPAPKEATSEPPPLIEVSPECTACEGEGVKAGLCEQELGCANLAGNDKTLCVNLVNCMRASNCWVKDPLDCLCGTAKDEACITNAANGVCRAEMQAATKSTDPIKNGTLFYDPSVPAGLANRLISCDRETCLKHCALPN